MDRRIAFTYTMERRGSLSCGNVSRGEERPHQALVNRQVAARHPIAAEPSLEVLSHSSTVEPRRMRKRIQGARNVIDDKTGNSLVDHLGHGPSPHGADRRAIGHRFDHSPAQGLRPVDWKQ